MALVSRPAGAVEAAALYQAYWAGLPAGEIQLTLKDDNRGYHDKIEIRSEGLPRIATRFNGTAISEGSIAAAAAAPGRLVPVSYDAQYDLRKRRGRRLVMRFAARGDGAGAIVADRGPGDTSKKPPLAQRLRTNVLDPLSALSAIRQELRRGNRGPFSVPVYDGARRFDVIVRVQPPQPADASTLRLNLTLAPIAGFKGETSEEGDPDSAPRPVALTMSNDDRLMPLSMRVSLYYMPLIVELKRWCDAAAPCAW